MTGTPTDTPSPRRPSGPQRRWPLTLLKGIVVATSALVAAGVAAAVAISHTTAGRDLALEWALDRLRPSLAGTIRVGSMGPGGLLAGVTVHDVELADGLRRPVLVADSVRARFSVAGLLGGPPAIADLRVWSPVVHLEPEPGEPVALSGLFAGREPGDVRAVSRSEEVARPLFRVQGVGIHGGTVIMRDATGAEERVTGIEADFSRIAIGPSREVALAAEVDELALSYPVGSGGRLELSGVRAEVEVGAGEVEVRAQRFRLPGSAGRGRMLVDTEDPRRPTVFDLDFDRLSLAELAWLDGRLEDGVVRGGVRIALRGGEVHVDLSAAEVDAASGSLTLSGGVSIADRVRYRRLRVGARMLAVAEIERWLPAAPPISGAVSGDLVLDGVPGRLEVSGDLTLFDGATLETRARARGGGTVLGIRAFDGMAIEFEELDYALLEHFVPGVPWAGRGDLALRADGELKTGMAVHVAANHSVGAGSGNTVEATGRVYGDTTVSVVDLDAALSPLSLSAIRRRWPAFPLAGAVTGSVSVNGSLEDLGFAAELETSAGPLSAEGRINGRDLAAGYQITAAVRDFELSELFGGLPDSTIVSGRAHLSGRGLELDSLRGALAISAGASRVGTLRLDTVAAIAWVDDDGLMHLGTLYAKAGGVVLQGRDGTLGVASGATGSGIGVSVASRSIRPLRPVFMDGTLVAWDELSPIEQERMEFAGVDPDTFPTLREIRFDGTVDGEIRLVGGLGDLRAEVDVAVRDLEYGPSSAGAVKVAVTATGLGPVRADTVAAPRPKLVLEGEVVGDSVVVEGTEVPFRARGRPLHAGRRWPAPRAHDTVADRDLRGTGGREPARRRRPGRPGETCARPPRAALEPAGTGRLRVELAVGGGRRFRSRPVGRDGSAPLRGRAHRPPGG